MTDHDQQTQAIFAACEHFRAALATAECRDYLLATLFLKHATDCWHALWEEHARELGDDSQRIARRMARARLVLPMITVMDADGKVILECFQADFRSLYARRERPNLGELFDTCFAAIENANLDKLEGVFRNLRFNSEPRLGRRRERNQRLKVLLEDLSEMDFHPAHARPGAAGEAGRDLLGLAATEGAKAPREHGLPGQLVRLLVLVADPGPGDRVCDPTCGSGGLLAAAAARAGGEALFGQEADPELWMLARLNLLLHGHDRAHIECGDVLASPLADECGGMKKFDIVLSHPPIARGKWDFDAATHDRHGRYWRGMPPRGRGDYAYLSHMVEAAAPGSGRAAAVVPLGVLFRAGAEKRIRQRMVEDNILDAVIQLPPKLLADSLNPVAVLLFDRSREAGGARELVRDVLFMDASAECHPVKNRNALADLHLDSIMAAFRARQPIERVACLATMGQIAENKFDLSIQCYLGVGAPPAGIDLPSLERQISRLEAELADLRAGIANNLLEMRRT